jgi:curved DNA-binding protein CbpA
MSANAPNIYKLLSLPATATRGQVKKAFSNAAKAAHPDKGGNTDSMAIVSPR